MIKILTYDQMSGTFYSFTCITVLSDLFFWKTVLTFSFHFLCRLLRTKLPLFRPIVSSQYTVYKPTLKCLICFLNKNTTAIICVWWAWCLTKWPHSVHADFQISQFEWRKREQVTMKANFIHFGCVESESTIKIVFIIGHQS